MNGVRQFGWKKSRGGGSDPKDKKRMTIAAGFLCKDGLVAGLAAGALVGALIPTHSKPEVVYSVH